MVAASSALALTACGGDDGDPAGGGSAAAATGEAPTGTAGADTGSSASDGSGAADGTGSATSPDVDRDATLRMAYTSGVSTFDPHVSTIAGDTTYWMLVYDRLTEIAGDLSVQPMLATDWTFSADGTTMDMTLRDDVVFHDGTAFDADAVVANIERAKTIEGSSQANALSGVESVEALDAHSVRFHLTGAAANLPAVLSTGAGAMISPKAITERSSDEIGLDPADSGSGPYIATDVVPQQTVTFERAPETWEPEHALLATLQIDYVPQTDARLNALRTGDYDIANVTGAEASLGLEMADQDDLDGVAVTINTTHGLMLNPTRGVLANQQIRQAINYAIDREALAEGLFDGLCETRFQVFPEGTPWNVPELDTQYPYDPDTARELIAESGETDVSFDVVAPSGPSYQALAQVMQAQLDEVGITMNIVPGELAPAVGDFVAGNSDSLMLVVLGYADPGLLLDQWYLNGAGGGMLPRGSELRAHVEQEATAALDSTLTVEERAAKYADLFLELGEESVSVPGCATTQVWVHKPDVVGIEDMPYIWAGTVAPYTLGRTG